MANQIKLRLLCVRPRRGEPLLWSATFFRKIYRRVGQLSISGEQFELDVW